MINRIRDIRRQKGLTLADVAERCRPATTAQTIGRIETGIRGLSLEWMNRIAAALEVEPQTLVRDDQEEVTYVVARLAEQGAEALDKPMGAVLPDAMLTSGELLAMTVEASSGDYRAGDLVWLRRMEGEATAKCFNRDVLAPRPGGRFAFGRLIDQQDGRIVLLPPGAGKRQVVIERPGWVAVAQMLVRPL